MRFKVFKILTKAKKWQKNYLITYATRGRGERIQKLFFQSLSVHNIFLKTEYDRKAKIGGMLSFWTTLI